MNAAHSNTATFKLHKTVVLVGMMGSGKTAIGRSVSAALGVAFRDSDYAIEEAAALTISEIFERDGEAFFRAREAEVIRRLLSLEPSILSTGGGAFMNAKNREIIDKNGVSLWLNADLDTLWERVRHKDTRPLLRTDDPLGTLTGLFNDRVPTYAKSTLHVAISPDASIEETTRMVIDALCANPDILEVQP